MLKVEPEKRPTTIEILGLPIMKSRSEDREMKEKFESLKKK